MLADLADDGFEGGEQVADLGGQPGQRAGLVGAVRVGAGSTAHIRVAAIEPTDPTTTIDIWSHRLTVSPVS